MTGRSAPSETGRPPLSRERIVGAALAMIDEDGLEGLTIRRLGANLGVEGMALYRHVDGKDAILDGVRELLVHELSERHAAREPFTGWRDRLEAFAECYHAVGLAHPRAFTLLARRAERAWSAGRQIAADMLAAMIDAGFDIETAIGAERAVTRYVLGFGLIESAGAGADAPFADAELADLEREQPMVGRLVRTMGSSEAQEDLFRLGLGLILDGLETRLPGPGA